jgi:hypothetical protein
LNEDSTLGDRRVLVRALAFSSLRKRCSDVELYEAIIGAARAAEPRPLSLASARTDKRHGAIWGTQPSRSLHRLSPMYLRGVSSRSRLLSFGAAGLLVVGGGLCAALVNGLTGQLLTIVLISLGLGAAVLLLFLEVGLSEDRARADEEKHRRERSARRSDAVGRRRLEQPRWRRRPG